MTGRRHIGLVAGAATLLAALPLTPIFAQWTWLVQCVIAVVLIEGAAMLARSLRAPAWAQVAAMAGALLVVLTFLAPDSKAILGLIPTTETFTRFGELLTSAGTAMREMGVPVTDHDGLLFLTVLGVGGVAICVDVCAVILRRPALAGLPMLAIYSVPVAVALDSVPVLPFIAGAAGFLWLLVADNVDRVRRFGRRFTGDGRDIDVWEPSPLAAAGRRLAIVGVLVAVVLPLAVPGMTTGLLDRFGTGGGGTGGSGSGGSGRQVNLWAMLEGTLKQDEPSDMVRVTTSDPTPGYLRFGVADELREDGFRNRPPSGTVSAASLNDPRDGQSAGVSRHVGKATVDIVSFNMRLLPVYSEPIKFTRGIDATWFYDRNQQIIFSNRDTTAGKKYEFDYVRSDYDPDALRRAGPARGPDLQRYTSVPVQVPEVVQRVATLTKGKTNEYDKVRALYDYFSAKNGFEYSLQATSQTSGPAIVEFLEERKSGYCVQYAAALAWMVRQAGIPARVAFGFTRGTRDANQPNTHVMTNQNLHAWTEVYFSGFGWLAFDATPSTFITGSVDPGYAPNPDAPSTGGPGVDATPGPNQSGLPGAGGDQGDNTDNIDDNDGLGGAATGPTQPRWPGYLAVAALVVLFLLALPAIRRALLRRGRRPRGVRGPAVAVTAGPAAAGDPVVTVPGGPEAARARHDAHAAWDELIDTLVDYRLTVDPAETPRMTAERVVNEATLRDSAKDGVRLLGAVEERARYARTPLGTELLGSSLRAVRRAIARRASRRTRLRATLLPPSVLQRWRMAAVVTTATVVEIAGRWRDALTRALSPRRLLPSRGTR